MKTITIILAALALAGCATPAQQGIDQANASKAQIQQGIAAAKAVMAQQPANP